MAYVKKPGSTYDVRRMHLQFRSLWEEGLKKARTLVSDLKSKGWNVDENFYFGKKQTDQEKRRLKTLGFDVQEKPILKVGDEEIYIIAYKPTERKGQTEATETTSAPPKSSKKPKASPLPPLKVLDNFRRIFYSRNPPHPDDVDKGCMMEPQHAAAVITADADPQRKVFENLKENAEKIIDMGETRVIFYPVLVSHKKNGNKYVRVKCKNDTYYYNIDLMKKAVRVLGMERRKTVRPLAYISTDPNFMSGVMVVTDGANKVLIAPAIRADPSRSAPLTAADV